MRKNRRSKGAVYSGDAGFALVAVLILMFVGSFIVVPLLAYMGTSVLSTKAYDNKTHELYAADAGIEDAFWRLKYDHMTSLGRYSPYEFSDNYSYTLPELVNTKSVNVTISNVWIPKDVSEPEESLGRTIIEEGKLVVTGRTVQTGIALDDSTKISEYVMKISYYPESGETLAVSSLGIWLPQGFAYFSGGIVPPRVSSLEDDPHSPCYVVPEVSPWSGGQAVTWEYSIPVSFANLPDVQQGDMPMTADISFYYRPPAGQPGLTPDVVGWLQTEGVPDIPYAWNADVKVFKIVSTAGDTTVESYVAQSGLRQLQAAIAGDYYATGNSLLSDGDGDRRREFWHDPSSASVTDLNIPQDADVSAAYLYWSGWKNDSSALQVFYDSCSDLGKWVSGSAWNVDPLEGRMPPSFANHHDSGVDSARILTMKDSLDLSQYAQGLVLVSWDQWVEGDISQTDGLDFSFSGDGGVTWSSSTRAFRGNIGSSPLSFTCTVPSAYIQNMFKVRYRLVGSGHEVHIDNISVSALRGDISVVFNVNGKQVYLDPDGNPAEGTNEVLASRTQVVRNFAGTQPHGFSYSSFRDVTALVREYSTPCHSASTGIDNYPGYATYSVGGVYADANPEDEWAYANWSLLLVYTSDTAKGHQLYLFDRLIYSNEDVNVDFDGDGKPGGDISGFLVPTPVQGELNAAKMTVYAGEGDEWYAEDYVAMNGTVLWDGTDGNVNSIGTPRNAFNSISHGLGTYDGIDIDTLGINPGVGQFITWESDILQPQDTSAHVDMVTRTDSWNMVYLVLSFRSDTRTRGVLSYTIR